MSGGLEEAKALAEYLQAPVGETLVQAPTESTGER
jgi:hypothetical protein